MLIRNMVSLRGQEMVVNLIVIDMPNFDVILDMDFLGRYGAKTGCRKKKV